MLPSVAIPRALLLVLFLIAAAFAPRASGYSVLTHEQLIDLTWQGAIAPLLRSRYPGITPEQLEQARAYAYGGCVIQDIGYYPFGDRFFSDLTHYVRSGDFVVNLFREARNPDELAFAVGALSHYMGDTIGHPEATNVAVPVEFPSLAARYGPTVNYAQDPHAHVQTEFAFDIDEIAHHRFAPVHYLRSVGLQVPVRQLSAAFYDTYGFSEDFSAGRRLRINVGGYRFAVRSLVPRVAYAVTLLHRGSMPPDSDTDGFLRLQSEIQAVSAQNGWERYRKKPGIGTYSLAGLIFVLPKLGPLKLLAIKGPSEATEKEYVRSVNLSADALCAAIAHFGQAHHPLPNRDLDTGAPVRPGGYPLTDNTYAKLLMRLTTGMPHPVPPGLKSDVLRYYADPGSPIATKRSPRRWARVQQELATLEAMPVSKEPADAETSAGRQSMPAP